MVSIDHLSQQNDTNSLASKKVDPEVPSLGHRTQLLCRAESSDPNQGHKPGVGDFYQSGSKVTGI